MKLSTYLTLALCAALLRATASTRNIANAADPADLVLTNGKVYTVNYTFRCDRPWGVWSAYEPSAIQPGQKTLGHCMQEAGYVTSFYGKWYLGGRWHVRGGDQLYDGPPFGIETDTVDAARGYASHGPGSLGFDYACSLPAGIQAPPFAFFEDDRWMKLAPDSEIVKLNWRMLPPGAKLGGKGGGAKQGDSKYNSTAVGFQLASKAVGFMDRQQTAGKPFFVYYCSQAVHHPHTPPKTSRGENVAGTTPSDHGDMILEFDLQVGMMVEHLKKTGLYENTLFVFASDNGGLAIPDTLAAGHDPSNGLREFKGSIYEGGHRVPLNAVWPNWIQPGSECHQLVMVQDLMATLYDLTGRDVPVDQARDSQSFLPLLLGQQNSPVRKTALVTTGQYGASTQEPKGKAKQFAVAVYEGDWKLIAAFKGGPRKPESFAEPVALFNLVGNVTEDEAGNLINEPSQQDLVKRMLALFEQMRGTAEVGRTTPMRNTGATAR